MSHWWSNYGRPDEEEEAIIVLPLKSAQAMASELDDVKQFEDDGCRYSSSERSESYSYSHEQQRDALRSHTFNNLRDHEAELRGQVKKSQVAIRTTKELELPKLSYNEAKLESDIEALHQVWDRNPRGYLTGCCTLIHIPVIVKLTLTSKFLSCGSSALKIRKEASSVTGYAY